MTQNKGAIPGSHASHEAPSGLRPSGFDPERVRNLAEQCEGATGAHEPLDTDIWIAVGRPNEYLVRDLKLDPPDYTASMDAAIMLVPDGWTLTQLSRSDNRKYWSAMCWPDDPWQDIRPNVPDGAALTPALAITAAALRAYAIAMEAAKPVRP
jgi:hypothetical protein